MTDAHRDEAPEWFVEGLKQNFRDAVGDAVSPEHVERVLDGRAFRESVPDDWNNDLGVGARLAYAAGRREGIEQAARAVEHGLCRHLWGDQWREQFRALADDAGKEK